MNIRHTNRHMNKLHVSTAIDGHAGIDFLTDHLRHANLLSLAKEENQEASDKKFASNEAFWGSVLSEETRALKWIRLNNFQIVDWYPRSPGLYHFKDAEWTRRGADQFIREENGVEFYEPHGKILMVQGGLGDVRFKSIRIENEDCWLCTATSDGYCHSGVPLAIPNRIIEKVGFDSRAQFDIRGQIRFLPDFLEPDFYHLAMIPQVHVYVDRLEKISSIGHPVYITPIVFFTTKGYEGWKGYSSEDQYNGAVSYVKCEADNLSAITDATNWLEWYTHKYDGEIITNFDQQRPTFENAPFSLQNVMSGQIGNEVVFNLGLNSGYDQLLKAIEKAKIVALTVHGGSNMRDINISGGDFRGAILNINSTLTNTTQSIAENKNLDNNTKENLQQLISQLNDALQKVPPEKAEEAEAVAKSAKLLVDTATEEKPNRAMLNISGDGLKKAAQNIAEAMPDVLRIATQILASFNLSH